MKLLPHYFKWIGIGLLILSVILGVDGFYRGLIDGLLGKAPMDFVPVFPNYFPQLSNYAILLGLLVYILAKNKTEDEFAQKLRYESAFIVLILTIVILFLSYLVNPDITINPAIILLLQMFGYLIVRSLKRGVILGVNNEK